MEALQENEVQYLCPCSVSYQNWIKNKKKEYQKLWYNKNREKINELRRKRYQLNKEKIIEENKRWLEKNKDWVKEYHKQYNKQYYQNNKESELKRMKQYQHEHREELTLKQKEYKKTQMGRARYLVQDYKNEDKKHQRGKCTLTTKWIVDNIFSKHCHYCGESDWTKIGCDRIDNLKPHTPDNVVPCCFECNRKKGTQSYEKYMKIWQ